MTRAAYSTIGAERRVSGANPQRKSYASYASFSDPDGNGWVFQEVTARLTGHIEAGDTSFTAELANVIRRAAAAQPLPDDELKIIKREADKEDKVAA
jgi:hypothetical protein